MESQDSLAQWAPLSKKLPVAIFDKYPNLKPPDNSPNTLIQILINLCNLHQGEVVEATRNTTIWKEKEGKCPDMPPTGGNEDWNQPQFLCYPKPPQPKGKRKVMDHPPADPNGRWEFGKQQLSDTKSGAIPDWWNQRHRCYCPAAQPLAGSHHFERHTVCTNLPNLFAGGW